MAVGFFVGFAVGTGLTFGAVNLCEAQPSAGPAYTLCRYLEAFLSLPGALTHTGKGLASAACTNGAFAGAATAVGVRVLIRRWQRSPVEAARQAAARKSYSFGQSLRRALAGGLAAGAGITLLLVALSYVGGEVWQIVVLFPISALSRTLCQEIGITWSNIYDSSPWKLIFTFAIAPAALNGAIAAAVCAAAVSVRHLAPRPT